MKTSLAIHKEAHKALSSRCVVFYALSMAWLRESYKSYERRCESVYIRINYGDVEK